MNAEEAKVRLPLFDVTKALMMLWVIWGHLGFYNIVGIPDGGYPHMANAKIAVNMPVFFMISAVGPHVPLFRLWIDGSAQARALQERADFAAVWSVLADCGSA